jgi:hypothetical protein
MGVSDPLAIKHCFKRAQAHDTQRPKTCLRPGSASGLNANSHPIGRGPADMLKCCCALTELDLATTLANRSPLLVRLMETSRLSLLAAWGAVAEHKVAPTALPSTTIAILSLRGMFIANLPPTWRYGRLRL